MSSSSPSHPALVVLRGRAFTPFLSGVKVLIDSNPNMPVEKLVKLIQRKYQTADPEQVKRVITRVRTGRVSRSGTRPNLSLCATRDELAFMAKAASASGSKAGVFHDAMSLLRQFRQDKASAVFVDEQGNPTEAIHLSPDDLARFRRLGGTSQMLSAALVALEEKNEQAGK